MKKLLFLILFASSNLLAWGGDSGKINRLWTNGWPNKPDIVCVELLRSDSTTRLYGVRADAVEGNKERLFSTLLAAQLADKNVQIYYHPPVNSVPHGPDCEIGNNVLPSDGIQTVSILP